MVSRGKFTEGKDFPDKLSRGIFLVGIPNMYTKNPKVLMK